MTDEHITSESMDDYSKELEATFIKISEGDILTGTVIHITETEVTLDLKYYTEGIITSTELSNDPNFNPMEEIHIGDEISATVIKRDDGEGHILLSRKEANDILAWDKLKEYMEEATLLNVKITGVVNKGVVAYIEGIRGFIPASKIDVSFVEDVEEWLNKQIDVIVIEANPEEKRLVLSGKEPALKIQEEKTRNKISNIVVGSVVEGKVETIKPYGAFVSLGDGLSGLLHISQISHKRIKSPDVVLSEGQIVTVKIVSTNDNKIGLSIKALSDEEEVTEARDNFVYEGGTEEITTGLGDLLKGFKFD
ncbi:MAG: S1 RNA-binding domain-containing protein [Clostridiales bacterium]|nr:S1 RNA-binding domain-containing protein [Clostridiales bacterium]